MPAIPIKLDDSWTRNCVSQLYISRDGIFSGCGISFDVWKDFFSFDDSSWYGAVYGCHSDGFIAISAPNIKSSNQRLLLPKKVKYSNEASIDIEESGISALTDVELSQCDIHDLENINLETIDRDRNIKNWISIKGDYAFAFPSSVNSISEAIRTVLGVHQYYIDAEMNEQMEIDIAKYLENLLNQCGTITLVSNPLNEEIIVYFKRKSEFFIRRLLNLMDSFNIVLFKDTPLTINYPGMSHLKNYIWREQSS